MPSDRTVIIGGLLLAGWLYAGRPGLAPPPHSPNTPSVVVPADVAAKVEHVRPLLAQLPATDRAELARFWGSLSWSLANMSDITTTTQARNVHAAVAPRRVQVQRVPGLAAAVDAFLESTIGNDPVRLDDAKRRQAAEAFAALAAAAGG